MSAKCKSCLDTYWVCENHADRPWDGYTKDDKACGCGAGMPCEVCNVTEYGEMPKFPKGLVVICGSLPGASRAH